MPNGTCSTVINRPGKSLLASALSAIFLLQFIFFPAAEAVLSDKEGAIAINFFWNTNEDFSKTTWLTREVEVTKSAQTTYFSIIGNWTPPFYLGIQQLGNDSNGKPLRNAIFSAWDTYENNNCTNCTGDSAPSVGRTTIKDLGPGVRAPGRFGYEGTGVNSFIDNFDWQVGDKVKAVVNLREVSDGTEISAAIQLRNEPWRYFGTYKYVKKFTNLEPGYSFIEDFWNSPTLVRSAEYSNTWMENEDLSIRVPITSVSARANDGLNTPYHFIRQINKNGHWAQTGGTEFVSDQQAVSASIEISAENYIPVEARIAALNLMDANKELYRTKYLKWESDRIAAAELKIKLASEAKIAVEAKKKLDAEISAYGDLDGYAIYSDPDSSESNGFYEKYRFEHNLKRLVISESAPDTNFTVIGNYGSTPTFSGGMQEDSNGKRRAFLTAVNLDDAVCKQVTCEPQVDSKSWVVNLVESESQAKIVQQPWGIDVYSDSFTWVENEQISWLTTLAPEKTSSLLSVSIQIGNGHWRHFATFRYPALYKFGLSGGYSGIGQVNKKSPFTPRSMTLLPTILSNYLDESKALTNLYLLGPKDKNRHDFKVEGSNLVAAVGIDPREATKSEYRLQLEKPKELPILNDAKIFSATVIDRVSSDAKAYRESIIAKAAADLKAKQEAEAKAAADLKAKQEAEAKAAADLKAKQEAEAKAAADKAAAEKILSDAKAEAARILAVAKAATKKITITCMKGKLTKKVTAIKPKCPSGYKKKP
jgi:hypothetical protein